MTFSGVDAGTLAVQLPYADLEVNLTKRIDAPDGRRYCPATSLQVGGEAKEAIKRAGNRRFELRPELVARLESQTTQPH